MASLKRVEHKSGRVVYHIVICMGYDNQGNKLVKNLTYSVNQSATPKQQEKEALKYAMDMEDKIKYGYDFDAEKMSFEDFAYKWLESVKDNIAYGTYTNYQHFLESRIIPYFKGFKLAHIRTPHIEAFLKTLVDDYSAGTIRGYANVLSGIFKTAKRWSMIDNNPCQDARKPKKVQEEQDIKFFTPEQSLMFLKSLNMSYVVTCKGHERVDDTGKPYYVKEYTETYTVPTQYKVFFNLSLFCGFRKGETLALHWDDIDFGSKEISIAKSVGKTESGFDYKEPKTQTSIRTVPFPEEMIVLLRQYHSEYIQERFRHGTAWQGDLEHGGNIFIQSDGKRMGHTTPYGLLLWDGYRPQCAVDCFLHWVSLPENDLMKKRYYPNIKRAEMVAKGYVASQSSHSRGGAVDLTIFSLDTGLLVPMGGDFDLMDVLSHHGASGLTETETNNRKRLRHIMESSGFEAYCNEWWHYVLIDEPYPDTYFNFCIS